MANSFLAQCRENFFNNITPSNPLNYQTEGYKKLIFIAQEFFKDNQYKAFAGYLMEGQYLVALWCAHMLVEYGNPEIDLKRTAINVIKQYTENTLASKVAVEEKEWLQLNKKKYKEYF